MTRILPISLILITITSCVPYTQADKIAFAAYIGGTMADVMTTRQGLQAGCRETNPILDDHPSDRELISLKLVATGILWGFGEVWPDKREEIWYTFAAIQGGAAIWNSQQY